MATRKKAAPRPSKGDAHDFSVVVEEMRGHFKGFGEALQGLQAQVTTGFETMRQKFAEADARFEQMDRRFEQIDRRFEQVDARFDRVEHEIALVKEVVLEHGHELKAIRTDLTRKVDRDEVESIVEDVLARRAVG